MLWFEGEHMKVYWDVALIYIVWSRGLFYPQKQNKKKYKTNLVPDMELLLGLDLQVRTERRLFNHQGSLYFTTQNFRSYHLLESAVSGESSIQRKENNPQKLPKQQSY